MESLCATNPVQNFYIQDELYDILFHNAQMMPKEVKATKKRPINTNKF